MHRHLSASLAALISLAFAAGLRTQGKAKASVSSGVQRPGPWNISYVQSGVRRHSAATPSTLGGDAKAPGQYFWPMARGPIGSHSTSPYKGPRSLSTSLKWTWTAPEGKWKGGISSGTNLIDDKKNIYAAPSQMQIVKFSPDGVVQWVFNTPGPYTDIPAIMDGALYSTAMSGFVFAVDMETGTLKWQTPPVCTWKSSSEPKFAMPPGGGCDCRRIGGDLGAVGASKGMITVKTHAPPGGGACKAAGLNASNGEVLWDYAFDQMVWNYYPVAWTDDGESFIFQDSHGGVYRLGLDGREIWTAGLMTHEKWYETFTDGGVQIGPNGLVYSMKAFGRNEGPGIVKAWRVSDGSLAWQSEDIPLPPNSWPAIGKMRDDDPLTVIVASGRAGGEIPNFDSWKEPDVGKAAMADCDALVNEKEAELCVWDAAEVWIRTMQPEVWGMDAETGKVLWKWSPPVWTLGAFRGDYRRLENKADPCVPNPVGNPTIDANGNVYLGMLDGFVYHLVREDSGPGVKVESKYYADNAFSSGGVSMAPGMTFINSCFQTLVFRGED